MREQKLEQGLAFARLDAVDVRRESLVDEQSFAAADRMGADYGMIDRRVLGGGPFLALLECGITLPAFGRKGLRHRMPRRQAVQEPAQGLRQRFVGCGAVRPERIPSNLRVALGGEDARDR